MQIDQQCDRDERYQPASFFTTEFKESRCLWSPRLTFPPVFPGLRRRRDQRPRLQTQLALLSSKSRDPNVSGQRICNFLTLHPSSPTAQSSRSLGSSLAGTGAAAAFSIYLKEILFQRRSDNEILFFNEKRSIFPNIANCKKMAVEAAELTNCINHQTERAMNAAFETFDSLHRLACFMYSTSTPRRNKAGRS